MRQKRKFVIPWHQNQNVQEAGKIAPLIGAHVLHVGCQSLNPSMPGPYHKG